MTTAFTFGDRHFEKCLSKAKRCGSKEISDSLHDDGPLFLDTHRELQSERRFFEELDSMSRFDLIDKIKVSEDIIKDLREQIGGASKLIFEQNKIVNSGDSANQEVVEHISKVEKKILSKQFDEAFQITSPKES